LLDLHEDLATGQLVLQRGRVSKTVDLVNGNPVSTASTPRDETLGHFLTSAGVISEDQHKSAVARTAEVGGKLGEALIALRMMSVEQLIDQLGRQARHKLVQALRWPQGAWRFDEAHEPIEGIQLRMVEVVLGGLRETAVEDLARLSRLDGMSFTFTERGERLRHELRRMFGETTVMLLEEGAVVSEIERAFPERVQGRLALDAMLMCDAINGRPVGAAAVPRRAKEPTASPLAEPVVEDSELYDVLFDEVGMSFEGDEPLIPEHIAPEDSGVVSLEELYAVSVDGANSVNVRQELTAEHQRVKAADHYAALKVSRRATSSEIHKAFAERIEETERWVSVHTDARERAKFDELHAAYAKARTILVDAARRAAYDRELAGGELVQVPPAIDTELSFRIAEELMIKGQWAQALGHIRTVISRAPNEADYHAALGWSEWMASGEDASAADSVRSHLNVALEIDPDHPSAHYYKGRIEAKLHNDDAEALFHLERAIDLDPLRIDALAEIETLLVGRGELRRLERSLKRVLFRLRGKGNAPEAKAWVRMARLYLDHLDDRIGANAAIVNAQKIAPQDPEVIELVERTATGRPSTELLRSGWREALEDPTSGEALVTSTAASGHADAAFLAASTMVALGTAGKQMAALYEQQRLRGVITPPGTFAREQWALLCHKEDSLELGHLMELLAPAVHAISPMTLAESDLDPSLQLAPEDIPPVFAKLRLDIARLLGVPAPAVYPRVELGKQIHVLATSPSVLVAGDEALTSPERPELVFRMVRAMTFLPPGRAVGASRPGRVMRAVVMAAFREASGSNVGLEDPLASSANKALGSLSPDARTGARAAALRLLSRGGGLNLTAWARALTRTADRVGMLLCGDVPAAFAGANEMGQLDRDLQDFAFSAAHVKLRAQLGLSRG
jgi:tetratricopeptide (TPR) repeat protein